MARDFDYYMNAATEAFNAGFQSNAARKRAMEDVSRAWRIVRDENHSAQIAHANESEELSSWGDARTAFFIENDLPLDLHNVRAKHYPTLDRWNNCGDQVRAALDLRHAIKAAELLPTEPKAAKVVEAVRKSILEEMETRKAQYVRALEIGRHFGGLPVSVNAHWVHGHKGAVFLRYFFYLSGKLTALNTLIAAADTLKREKEA